MEKKKFQLTQIDLIPEFGKIPAGISDSTGRQLHFGDCVIDGRGQKHYVAFRYGRVCLKQPFTAHTIGNENNDFSTYTYQNECAAFEDYTMIGHTDDPVYEQIKHLEHTLKAA